jgi:hypothetical protein
MRTVIALGPFTKTTFPAIFPRHSVRLPPRKADSIGLLLSLLLVGLSVLITHIPLNSIGPDVPSLQPPKLPFYDASDRCSADFRNVQLTRLLLVYDRVRRPAFFTASTSLR